LSYQNNSNSCVHLHGNNKKTSFTHLNSNISPLKPLKPSLDKKQSTHPHEFVHMNQDINAKSHLVYNNHNNTNNNHYSFEKLNK
jgi:hypothetical protein